MSHQHAAPDQADAPHPWVRAILHARIPAVLKLLLLALLGTFAKTTAASRTVRNLRQDWFFASHSDLVEDLDGTEDSRVLRRLLQLRAELGWLMRGAPNRGLSLRFYRAPVLRPHQAARAPPLRPAIPQTP
jgi:hypothetical protein